MTILDHYLLISCYQAQYYNDYFGSHAFGAKYFPAFIIFIHSIQSTAIQPHSSTPINSYKASTPTPYICPHHTINFL